MNSFCAILDSSSSIATTVTSSYGWWTRRIHISRFDITPFWHAIASALSRTISKMRSYLSYNTVHLSTEFATLSHYRAYRYRDPSATRSRMRYAWLCIRFTPSPIQLATTFVTRLHNRAVREICGHSLRNFAIDSGISQYDTLDVVAHGLNLVV